MEVDGVNKTGALTVSNTGGWQSWMTLNKTGVSLPAGQHVVRVAMDSTGAPGAVGNFNYISINPSGVITPQPKTITNTIGAYVADGASAGTNFGSSPILQARTGAAGTQSQTVLKFDLSSVSTINSAKLRLFGGLSTTANGSVITGVYVASNVWDETTVTWNTRPGIGPNPLVTATLTGTTNQWYEWDVTSYLKSEKANGINTVTLVLRNTTSSGTMASHESSWAAIRRSTSRLKIGRYSGL
jgi:hypothetical protein